MIDQVTINIRSGDGGNGMVAWRREKYEPLGGPAGGNGGRGGSVYIEATRDLNTLIDFRYKAIFEAKPGVKGGPKCRHGKHGEDKIIKVPVGTIVREVESGQVICDLVEPGQKVLLAEGGGGGRGNAQMASPTKRSPHFCDPGQPGISRQLELELKLLADVALVGLPNAGKSTLLSVMTAAKPKIADYPFTTLEPNLGVVQKPGGDGYVMADIPGLIKGASDGVGLGHKFLRHIERTRLIVHLVDVSSPEFIENIETINTELELYSPELAVLPQILVFNKIDLVDPQTGAEALKEARTKLSNSLKPQVSIVEMLEISCATRDGLNQLGNLIAEKLSQLPAKINLYDLEPDLHAYQHPQSDFAIQRHRKVFMVQGDRIDRLVSVTNMKSPESLHHLHQTLRSMGVIEALIKEGVKPGSEVAMGGTSFVFGEELY